MADARAVIYARFSSHNQRSESIEIQVEASRAYCAGRGYEVVGEYCDYAQTGRNTDRAEYQRMLADAKRGLFDVVVIYKVTRIMRNRDEMALLRVLLRKCGVEIEYAGESIPEDASGRTLMLGLLEVLAEWESDMNSERTKDGIRKNAERCMANGQRMYGWKIVDGFYEIEPAEHAHLVMMKDMLLDGRMVADIVRASEPYRTQFGNRFTQSGITKLLKREQNAGVYNYAGVRKEGGIPAQWTQEEQDAIMAVLSTRGRPRKQEGTAAYPLSGKLFHGKCGEPMTGWAGTGKSGRRYHYYRCSKCRKTANRDRLDEAVRSAVVETLADPKVRERITEQIMEAEDERLQYEPKLTATIDKELAAIERAYANIWKAIEEGVAPPGGKERVDELKAREEALRVQRKAAEKIEAVRVDRDKVAFWLDSIAECDPDDVIGLFVWRAALLEDGDLVVAFSFGDGSCQPDDEVVSCSSAQVFMPVVANDPTRPLYELPRVRVFWRGFAVIARYEKGPR